MLADIKSEAKPGIADPILVPYRPDLDRTQLWMRKAACPTRIHLVLPRVAQHGDLTGQRQHCQLTLHLVAQRVGEDDRRAVGAIDQRSQHIARSGSKGGG
jgi:hypothetical protein